MTATGAEIPPRRLRIGIDGRAFASPAAGVRRYVRELCEAMGAIDAPVDYVAIGAPADLELPAGVARAAEGPSLPTNLGRHVSGLPRAIAAADVDLYHAPAYVAPVWGRTPVVVSLHDVSYARHPEWYPYRRDPVRRAFYRRSARRAAAVITISAFSRDEIVAAYGISPARIFVTPLGASAFFSPAPQAAPAGAARQEPHGHAPDVAAVADAAGSLFVLHVGDLHPRRNVDLALRAVLALRREDAAWRGLRLVLAGVDRGVGAELRDEAARAGAPDAIACVGAIDEPTLRGLYRSAAAFVYPSRYEGFGLPLVEAMACGTPVVAARAAATPEVTGDAARLFEPGNESGCRAAIAAVLCEQRERPDRAAERRTRGIARAAEFTWARTARLTCDCYRACLRSATSGRSTMSTKSTTPTMTATSAPGSAPSGPHTR